MVDENTIRLNFEPSGRRGTEDPLLMDGKPNICVVCGTNENLTRHHIIPYCFIRHMCLEYKVDIIRDIFPLCEECHNQYETIVQEHRREWTQQLGVGISGIPDEEMRRVRRAMGSASAVKNYSHKIPAKNLTELKEHVKEFLGKDEITEEDLDNVCNYKITERPDYVSFSEAVAQSVTDYNDFARQWREHFVKTMKPKYMPDAWKVDRVTRKEDVWVPPRMLKQNHTHARIRS
jgi:hypothetical protein